MADQWEYVVAQVKATDAGKLSGFLTVQGMSGWEVVSITPMKERHYILSQSQRTMSEVEEILVLFKRRKP